MEISSVSLVVELTDEEAEAVAQLLKRIGFNDCRSMADSEEEAYAMCGGLSRVREALGKVGFSPR